MNFIQNEVDVDIDIELTPEGSVTSKDDTVKTTEDSLDEEGNEYTGQFEGPEKTMEVCFRPDMGHQNGLRAMTREQLDLLCLKAKCTILHSVSNNYLDAYVLSESSLFIYKHRFVMKTCGTTTLLRCLSNLLEFADALGLELTWVGYSRKNLLYPTAQLWPHSNFGDEIRYIDTHEKLQSRLEGNGHILGPITGDHWFVYVADHSNTSPLAYKTPKYVPTMPSTERTINMMMFDMDLSVASIFYQKNTATGAEMTVKSGINTLCPGAQIDAAAFTPCGYSMNAILFDSYFTIHITPEESCSYVSFETNTPLDNYNPLIRNVLSVFRPKRFVLTMFGDQEAVDVLESVPTDLKKVVVPSVATYSRTSMSSTVVETDLCCMMACYSSDTTAGVRKSDSAVLLTDVVHSINAVQALVVGSPPK